MKNEREDKRAIEYVKSMAENFPLASGGTLSASQFLQLFLFDDDKQYTYVSKLSGGEKQRLSIARALLRHPRLMVFDEATSALDSLTEEAISNTIREITDQKEHITVLIAHRLSTIMHADRIFVLEKGVIIETGKHSELLDEKGLYYAMWRQQIGERREMVSE